MAPSQTLVILFGREQDSDTCKLAKFLKHRSTEGIQLSLWCHAFPWGEGGRHHGYGCRKYERLQWESGHPRFTLSSLNHLLSERDVCGFASFFVAGFVIPRQMLGDKLHQCEPFSPVAGVSDWIATLEMKRYSGCDALQMKWREIYSDVVQSNCKVAFWRDWEILQVCVCVPSAIWASLWRQGLSP